MKIMIPATSANIGPGFDSVGVALSKYLTIEVLEPTDKWIIEHNLEFVPTDKNNLLIKTALKVTKKLQPHRIRMTSDIPLARGLGSSSSVIVAGIELANQLAKLKMTTDEKLQKATEIEGHPDNVAPAIYGNLVISSYVNRRVQAVVTEFPETSFVAFIPNYSLRTVESRGVLPYQMSYKKAVAASAIANVAIASLMAGDLTTAGRAIQSDMFHEPFRQSLVKEFCSIRRVGQDLGAYATYLSGAGPTVMILAPKEKEDQIVKALENLTLDGTIHRLRVDTKGIQIF
ncbi:homoserine kinase [Streptococcus ruminantium]|uniref:Homoserine kinase n=1 Tax=Streptococcus ruminantium TaxID=1917441 RepID=A0ABU1B0L6_9STRE|nr:homoserine kinase [Streptococcus ruminantium]MDQ8758472.1 homoserine kinase [Streptococcus ruminantium]MDQ8766271.1 homoserine kinase [Streptococcus ruminantium]MDQ8768167.1 homoserine kinase [Streptococcus ruminantium]MDQ8773936.1 homoserine kinase [Streptococcus ruminantium]MDQ8779811.1 homoserine kinase [Streptococcus ruminantium]